MYTLGKPKEGGAFAPLGRNVKGEKVMEQRTWLITGVSSGLGKAMAGQLLARGDRVIGTVRYRGKVADLLKQYP